MRKTKILFVIWAVIVVIVIGLLTTLGFMLRGVNKEYRSLEEKLQMSAEKYTSDNFMYPDQGGSLKITSEELIEKNYLDELKKDKDVCQGYVEVTTDKFVKYKAFIKCDKYTTEGYKKD